MLTPNFSPFPILETQRLLLRQITLNDVPELFILRSDEQVMKYLDKAPAKNHEEVVDFVNMITQFILSNEAINWAICLKGHDRMIGNICLWNIRKEHYRAELGYTLLPAYHRKGIMNEAITSVIHYGFGQMKLHSIEANVNPANEASVKILEKNKFVREAYFKENHFFNGMFFDSAIYSLLAPR